MKYRNTALVEAIQYRPHDNCREVSDFIGVEFWEGACEEANEAGTAEWNLQTLEGVVTCQPGDWIVKGVEGECWPIRKDIFEATYEPAE